MSFPKYPAVKDSGVEWIGEVPRHWAVQPLKRHARLLTEKTARRTHPVALENIESWTGRFVTTETEFEGEGVAFEEADVLFGKLRPYLAKTLVADSSGEAVGDFLVMRPTAAAKAPFMGYQLRRREVVSIIDGSTFGSKMPRASWDFVGAMQMTLPPTNEQDAIVTFLDCETAKIDTLVEEQRRLIDLLNEKRQALISQAVTKGLNPNVPMKDSGVQWLGTVPAHWEVKSIRYIIDAIGDVDHFMPQSVEEGVPYLMTGDLKDLVSEVSLDDCKQVSHSDYLDLSKRIRTAKGDVVMARYATIGTLMYVDVDVELLISYSCVTLKTDHSKMSGLYLFQYMKSDAFTQAVEHQVNTNTQGNVGINDLQTLKVAVPPVNEQDLIATFLASEKAKFDGLEAETERAISLLRERRSALISAAVTGKIDVRDLAPQPEAVAA